MAEVSTPMRQVWRSFARALDAEPRDEISIRGHSGLEHDLQAMAIDDNEKRLIVVSSEPSSRIAALVQSDIQAAYADYSVLLARPLVYDLAFIARSIGEAYRQPTIDINAVRKWAENNKGLSNEEVTKSIGIPFTQMLSRLGEASQRVKLPPFDHLVDIVRQGIALDWKQVAEAAKDQSRPQIPLGKSATIDNLAQDRTNGICPLPLYEFSESDWILLAEGHNDDVIDRLQNFNIYQYFFPPPDDLALSLVERGVAQPLSVQKTAELAPSLGHIFGPTEHVAPFEGSIPELLDQLGDKGYVAEGEHGIEITPEGRTVRTIVKFRPREGLISKILGRASFNLSVSPKDFLPR